MNDIDMIIQNTIESELEEIKGMPLDGLCIYLANNIHYELEQQGIDSKIFDISECTGVPYHHEFIIAKNRQNKNIYLVDPSYSQFLPKQGHQLITFHSWPADVLRQTPNGKALLDGLLENGYKIIEQDDIQNYLNSFEASVVMKPNNNLSK